MNCRANFVADRVDVAKFKPSLKTCERQVGIRQAGVADKATDRLKFLDRVTLDPVAQPVANDAVQIDQQVAA